MNNIKISNEVVFSVFFMMVVIFVLLSFQKYFLNMDYPIFAETSCDPKKEQCFVGYCDPEYEECSGIVEEDIFYYKKIKRLANYIPLCDPEDDSCTAATCATYETKCVQILCNLEDEESECFSSSINE